MIAEAEALFVAKDKKSIGILEKFWNCCIERNYVDVYNYLYI